MISGIQKQVIFHGSCSFLNNLDFDIRCSLVSQETQPTTSHPGVTNVTKEYIIPAGTTRPSVTISPSFIKSVGIRKVSSPVPDEDDGCGGDEFVIPLPQQEDDTHFTVQVQDGIKSLLCWLSFDYTSKIFGQLVVTVTPQFIFRNHFPYPVTLKAIARDNYQSTSFTIDGMGCATQVFDLFPQKWFNIHFSVFGCDEKSSTTAFPINTTMHELLKENDYLTDPDLNEDNWPFQNGTKVSLPVTTEQQVCCKDVETEEMEIPLPMSSTSSLLLPFKCRVGCLFQATCLSASLPTVVIDVKPKVLITNSTDLDLFVNTEHCVIQLRSHETTALLNFKKELLLGIDIDENLLWSAPVELAVATNGAPTRPQTLSPGSISHCSIVDETKRRCFQFSFTSEVVHGMASISVHQRFMVHNLSSFTLTMVPLMFNELDHTKHFECLSAIQLPPRSQHSFCSLNALEAVSSNYLPDGLAMNIHLWNNIEGASETLGTPINTKEHLSSSTISLIAEDSVASVDSELLVSDDLKIESNEDNTGNSPESGSQVQQGNDVSPPNVQEIILSKCLVEKRSCLLLSKEHLRETVIKSGTDGSSHPFVLTSGLDGGVLHIYIDEDKSIAVTLHNHTETTFVMKEVNIEHFKKQKRAEVLVNDPSQLLHIRPSCKTYYQPTAFQENFPRTENKLELNCQFALSEDTAELSQPVTIERDKSCKLFIPNHGEIIIKARTINSKLYVQLTPAEDTELQEVSLTHLAIPVFKLSLKSINVVVVDHSNHEKMNGLISSSLTGIRFNHLIQDESSVFKLTCGYIQVDNQVTGTLDHFPVLFLPMRQVSERYHTLTETVPFAEVEACLEADVFSLTFEMNRVCDNEDGHYETFLNNVRVNIQPCEMYVEDTMMYRLAAVLLTYLPSFDSSSHVQGKQYNDFENKCLNLLHPLRLCNIEIGEVRILLSLHASLKMFLAADHMPLVFKRYKILATQTVLKEFVRSVLYNYATQALVRVGWILGSLNIIGSPTGLIQSIGHGISDFFVLPYNGLIRGPTSFISGLRLGLGSLMRHVSTGALTSVNNVSSSISRNMDRLSFDEIHLHMQEESRADSPTKVSTGFAKAFGSLGMSLLGAVAGLADHPIQNVHEASNASEVISGVVSGIAKGMVGMVTKPIGGAAEFVSQASQGILQGAGLVRVPEKVFVVQKDMLNTLVGRESHMKYMWQFLHSDTYMDIMVIPNVLIKATTSANDEGKNDSCYIGAVVLTEGALLVYSSQESKMTSIFPLREVELEKLHEDSSSRSTDSPSSYKLQIYKYSNEQQHTTSALDDNPNFRQFFNSFRDAAVTSHTEVLCEHASNQSENAVLEVEMEPLYGELLVSRCRSRKNRLVEETYVVDCVDL